MSTTANGNSEVPTKKTASACHVNVKKGKNKKRKHSKQSPEELYQVESTDRYKKVHHACSKLLHREAKIVKSFECQKIVRAIKTANESVSAGVTQDNVDDGQDETTKKSSKALKRVETLKHKLDRTKKMDLEILVQVGLKRLGVASIQPVHEENIRDDNTTQSAQPQFLDTQMPSQNEDQFYQNLLESMLRHKRLSAALDQLNEKVTEYRQWTIYRGAMLRGEENPEDRTTENGKRKKMTQQQAKRTTGNDTIVVAGGFNSRKRGLDLGGHEGASGLFIGSLSGMLPAHGYDEGNEDHMDGNNDGDHNGYEEEKKKNRPGQRARKAKALAIAAKKDGKTWNLSTNWREKKRDQNESTYDKGEGGTKSEGEGERDGYNSKGNRARHKGSNGDVNKQKESQHIAIIGDTWKEEGNAHPSWSAAAHKSKGIAKFEGKKITFD